MTLRLAPRPRLASFAAAALFLTVSPFAAESPVSDPNPAAPPTTLEKIDVQAKPESLLNAIDRKIYRLDRDLQATTGSASDVLPNIPSVQVDVDGNVSLRGNDNVLILIDGQPSTLMSARTRADALAPLPADSLERIAVLTHPSARYQPDDSL